MSVIGTKLTWRTDSAMSASDPKRTLVVASKGALAVRKLRSVGTIPKGSPIASANTRAVPCAPPLIFMHSPYVPRLIWLKRPTDKSGYASSTNPGRGESLPWVEAASAERLFG
jgi:hypothetical protein